MSILIAALAIAAAQTAPASTDHSQHNAAQHAQHQHAQHAQHQGEHNCCKEVNGKMECQMMNGHGTEKGQAKHQGHTGH